MPWREVPARRFLRRAALVAALVVPSWAQDSAPEGARFRLLDAGGVPVAHAAVIVMGRGGAVITDAAGFFRLDPEPPPPFEIAVVAEGGRWLGLVRIEQLPREGLRELRLPPVERVEVSVQGGVAPSTHAPPGAAATIIADAENRRRRPARLVEALEEIPSATTLGPGQPAVPAIRGLARGRTLLLLDDGPVLAERRVGPSATYLDPFVLERIEVVRGPGSVAYGADAMGGVIHMRTRTPDPSRRSVRYEVAGGVGRPSGAVGLEANVPLGYGAWLVAAHARSFGDYRAGGTTVQNSQARDRGFLFKALWPAGRSRLLFGLQSDRAFDVGKPWAQPPGGETVYPLERSDRFSFALDAPAGLGFHDVELRLFVGRYHLVTDRVGARSLERSDVEATDALVRAIGTRPIPRGVLRVGFESRGRFGLRADAIAREYDDAGQLVAETTERAVASARRLDSGLFFEAERMFAGGDRSLAGGLRVQRVSSRNRGGGAGDRSRSDATLTGYVAATFRAPRAWSATVQLSRAFREPTLSDRYFSGVTGRGSVLGNPDLEPEKSRQLDVALRHHGAVAHLAIYAYDYRIRGLVERFRLDETTFSFRNRGEALIRGMEIESDVRAGAFLARFALGAARGWIRDDGTPADDIPPVQARASLLHRPGQSWWWRAGVGLASWDDAPGPSERPTPPYGVVDLAAGVALGERMELRLVVSNALDAVYPSSADEDAVDAPGRNLSVVLGGQF